MNFVNFTLVSENSFGKFYKRTIRDIETIFCIKNEQIYINYSYIVNSFQNNKHGFRHIIRSEQFLEDLNLYCRNNNIEFTRENIFENIPELLNEVTIFFNINRTNTNNIIREIQGTYGPTDFIDIILFNLSSEYRQEIHNLMITVQQLSDISEMSFRVTLQNTINELQERIRELEERNRNLNNEKEIYKNKFNYSSIVSKLKNGFINDNFEELHRRFDEQDKQHQETINSIREESRRNLEKSKKHYKKLMNKLKLNHAETIVKIGNHSKNNLERRTTNPSIPSKIECLRIYVNKIDLNVSEDSLIDLYSNRCQKENLKNLNLDRYEVIYNEELLANSVELYNNFLNQIEIEYTRVNSGRIQLERQNLDQFTDALTNFVSASNSLNTNKVIPEKISNDPNLNISMFTEFFNYKYYLNNRYRDLIYCESRSCLKFVLKVNNETIYIEDPQELVGTRIGDDSRTTYIINSIELINNKYHITYNTI